MNHIIQKLSLPALVALSGLFLLGTTDLAFAIEIEGTDGGGGGAGAATLGDMFFNSCSNAGPLATLFSYVSYAAGCFFALIGLNVLRLHTEGNSNNPLHKALMLFAGATGLLVLPSMLTTIASSLGYAVVPSMAVCLAAGNTGGGAAQGAGLDVMLANFVTNFKPALIGAVQVIANVAGVFMMVHGLIKASKYGYDPRANSIHSILTNIGFGAILFTIGGNFSMVMNSVFGTSGVTDPSAASVLSWGFVSAVGGGSQQFANAIAAALMFVQVIGFIAFVRGWMVMKKVVEGGGNVTMAQGITHIVGGVLAINIASFLKIMDTTFGTNLM